MLNDNDPKSSYNKQIAGIFLMLLHAIAMSVVYIVAKQLTQSLPQHQVVFMYKFTIFLAILPWCLKGGITKNLQTKKIGMHVTRGTFSVMASLCFMYAIKKVDASDAVAIIYLENILITIIGVLYFKEKMYHYKKVAIFMSFIGALFITKIGFGGFSKYYIFIFLALIFWAINNFAIKILCKSEHTKAQLFYVMFFSSILSFPLALQDWHSIEIWHVKLIFILAVCYLIHTIAFFKAFKFADISTVIPFDYSRLVFTGLLGYLILEEIPDNYSIIGYGLIVFGGLYSLHNETKRLKLLQVKKPTTGMPEIETRYEQV